MSKNFCRICQGQRGFVIMDGKPRCEGCGTPIANCHMRTEQRKGTESPLKCPQCRSANADLLEAGRWLCATCGTVYEHADVGFVDDRPVENAIKKELRK